ncbi:hypothetical protein [Nonlabens sp. Asnod3-A02]|uniref:hypothetical protein n=1 Tax=Nonlabens sp. Asnod3-A02 TaxID=3160579 RepID=UPI003866A35A
MLKNLIFTIIIISALKTYSQCFNGYSAGAGTILKTTGNAKLDSKFNSEKINIDLLFDVATDLYIMDDSRNPNALANCGSNVGDFDGTVRFGRNLLVNELYNSSRGEIAIAGILAHEIAHVAQCEYMSPLKDQFRELQADFLAGYYLGTRGDINYERLKNFYRSLYEKGDWSDPTHHGTPVQRVNAMLSGFKISYLNFRNAYNKSLEYIRGKSPSLYNDETNAILVNDYSIEIETIDGTENLIFYLKDIEISGQKNKNVVVLVSLVNEEKNYYKDIYLQYDSNGFKRLYVESDTLVPDYDSTSFNEINLVFELEDVIHLKGKTIIPLVQLYEQGTNGKLKKISEQYLKSFELSE